MRRTKVTACLSLLLVAFTAETFGADGLVAPLRLVDNGTARATIVAASDAQAAAERLNALMERDVNVSFRIAGPSEAEQPGATEILLCTVASRSELGHRLSKRAAGASLKPEGFLLAVDTEDGGRIVVVGGDRAGLRYGVGELWNYHLRLEGKSAAVKSPLWVKDAPAFSKRILWNWSFQTNWAQDLRRVHETKGIDPGGKRQPYLEQPDGYEKHFRRVIDYAADHKLNGLIIYGFINDAHGGVEAAQRLSRYAKRNSVRILPGVGTVIYGGYYHSSSDSKNPYSLTTWLANNPDVDRMVGKDGKRIEGAPCPSSPDLRKFLTEGADWFFTTFKDIGGVNLEHGDFFECQCDRCKAERAKPENDSNFLWDMMHTQVPVAQIAHRINPDLWITFSPYWGYNKEMMSDPPKFLKQYPDYAIVQWTYSGMAGGDPIENSWPTDLKPPDGAQHSIGLLHQGSYWSGPRQWWGSPGQTYALVADIIQRTCARAIDDDSEGLEIIGQIGSTSPQNELNYLAFEAFTWHPEQTMDEWFNQRLARLYGGSDRAHRFYELASDDTVSADALRGAIQEVEQARQRLTDPRQARRWGYLAQELARRLALVQAGRTKPFGPGPLEGVEDVRIEF